MENEDIDGIFCTDDLTAILVANQCHKSNISVPDQLKIIGYDGTKLIQNYFPQLTTMAQPISDYADVLIDLLLQRVQEPEKPLESHYHLPVKLIQGETT